MHPWTLDIAPDSRQTENISRRLVFAIGIAELACVVFYVIPRNNRFASWQQSCGKDRADQFVLCEPSAPHRTNWSARSFPQDCCQEAKRLLRGITSNTTHDGFGAWTRRARLRCLLCVLP